MDQTSEHNLQAVKDKGVENDEVLHLKKTTKSIMTPEKVFGEIYCQCIERLSISETFKTKEYILSMGFD